MALACIILAAGRGTRMKSDLPKVLHRIGGVPLVQHVVHTARALDPERLVVVTGPEGAAVASAVQEIAPEARMVVQKERRGTAHAVGCAQEALADFTGDVVVLYGDTPLVQAETLRDLLAARDHPLVVLGFETATPDDYGRLITRGNELIAIREHKDATDEERSITLCNSGVIRAPAPLLLSLISGVGNANAAGEYYLTDIIGIAREQGITAGVIRRDHAEMRGINTRAELAHAEREFQTRAREKAMAAGVTLTAPETVFFAPDTTIGRDSIIGPNVIFGPGVTIGERVEITGFCHLVGCTIAAGATLGPFARIRPGTRLGDGAHVGNFVEVKNSAIGAGAKIGHLSYIGDTDLGPRTNIGAGTITCNYDGVMKHRTRIGADTFIGSNTMLVAPVSVGDGALTASGSVITDDVPDGAMAFGRARQVVKPGRAGKFFARLRARKAERDKARGDS